MISTQDIRDKEVINIYDGRSLGFVEDIELNLERGLIEGIIVPSAKSGMFGLFKREEEYFIRWKDIRRIGDDVILVEVPGLYEGEISYDKTFRSPMVIEINGDQDDEDEADEEDQEVDPGYR